MTGSFVVTAAGLVTAAGDTPEAVFAALVARTPLAVRLPDDDLAAAEMTGFDAKRYISKRGVKDLSRLSQLACSAAAANARGIDGVGAEHVGVVFGSAWGSLKTIVEFEREAHLQGARFVDPILFTETVANVPAGQVAILYGWSAFNATVSSGSASGLAAMCQAVALLQEGRGRVAVAGGGDAFDRPLLRALRRRGAAGPVGGEGACFLTIESEAHAKERGAPVFAAIRSTGSRFVPGRSSAGGVARESMAGLVAQLIADAGLLTTSEVDLVVLSANGDPVGDVEEAGAVLDVLGDGPTAAPLMMPKSILGETWGASGPLAVVLAIEAMRTSTVPAAPFGFVPASELERLHVPAKTLRRPLRNALIIDRTESGHQLGLVLSLMEPHGDRS
jgi:3-oxoacyl-[acyl-carrier-protein] synthase II